MLAVSMLSGCSAPSSQSAVNTSGIFENTGTEQKENVDVSSNTQQEKFEEVKLDTEYSVEDFADFIVKKVETTKKFMHQWAAVFTTKTKMTGKHMSM